MSAERTCRWFLVVLVVSCLGGVAPALAQIQPDPTAASNISVEDIVASLQQAGITVKLIAGKFPVTSMEIAEITDGKIAYSATFLKCTDGKAVCGLSLSINLALPASIDIDDRAKLQAFQANLSTMQVMTAAQVGVVKTMTPPAYMQLNYQYPCEGFDNARFAPMVVKFFEKQIGKFASTFQMVQSIGLSRAAPPGSALTGPAPAKQ